MSDQPSRCTTAATTPAPCWQTSGVSGNRSCPSLTEHIHCRNCPVYAAAGRTLLDRPVTGAQIEDWTAQIAREREARQQQQHSACVFRIAGEWLALPTSLFLEVVDCTPIRALPHMTGGVMLGLASIRGEIRICMSLERLLGIAPAPEPHTRFCVIGDAGGHWVFPVHEVSGIHRFEDAALRPAPDCSEAGLCLFSQGILELDGILAGLLNADLLLHALERSLR